MQQSKQIYTIEQIRDKFEHQLSERKNIPEQKQILQAFDHIFKQTIFSQKALTLHQIEAIINDSKSKQSSQNVKDIYQILDFTLQKLHKTKHQKPKQQQQPQKQNQNDDDSFNFDSEQRQRQSSQDDIDDDYVNDNKKE